MKLSKVTQSPFAKRLTNNFYFKPRKLFVTNNTQGTFWFQLPNLNSMIYIISYFCAYVRVYLFPVSNLLSDHKFMLRMSNTWFRLVLQQQQHCSCTTFFFSFPWLLFLLLLNSLGATTIAVSLFSSFSLMASTEVNGMRR